MIAYLSGMLRHRHPARIVLDVHGVGYELQVPVGTYTQLPETGAAVALHVHTQVRDDAIQLFGFATAGEKLLFEKLITVNGVGPKLGLAILSGLSPEALGAALRAGDLARLSSIPGVGKKTAERLVVELRDKMPAGAGEEAGAAAGTPAAEDVVSALVNLGYPPALAQKAAQRALQAHPGAGFDQLFAFCMKTVGG
ncbi:MAG TPA: Holliday junction branch migration protein RuvA [Terriglobales bacterium]|nr:Holliday junction branch migration protein RuvA [Terriglobales bacterium]